MSPFESLKQELEPRAKLIAISKTRTADEILKVYNQGHRRFGENKVQDIERKFQALPKDIEWHFVGHLQSNKVKYIAPFIHCIHTVDSEKLMNIISKEALKNERQIKVLLQIKIAHEATKFGMTETEAKQLIEKHLKGTFPQVQIGGLMGMATNTKNQEQVRSEFKNMKSFFEALQSQYFHKNQTFTDISMGMSSDYKIALECGTTIVRIGTAIFGERNYNV